MNAQKQLNHLLDSLQASDEDIDKFAELKACFDENHIENFLEKLESMSALDEYISGHVSQQASSKSDEFIDFISTLIIKLK